MFTTSRNDFEMNKVFMITVKTNTFKSAYTQCVLTPILCNEISVSSQLYIFGIIKSNFTTTKTQQALVRFVVKLRRPIMLHQIISSKLGIQATQYGMQAYSGQKDNSWSLRECTNLSKILTTTQSSCEYASHTFTHKHVVQVLKSLTVFFLVL